jgi:hypothetical protein
MLPPSSGKMTISHNEDQGKIRENEDGSGSSLHKYKGLPLKGSGLNNQKNEKNKKYVEADKE